MPLPQNRTLTSGGGTPMNNTAASADVTSDPIPFCDIIAWALNVWFDDEFDVTGQNPQVTIEVSNDPNANDSSFEALTGATNVNVPHRFDDLDSTWLWMRIVYQSKGATAGAKYFDLTQWV